MVSLGMGYANSITDTETPTSELSQSAKPTIQNSSEPKDEPEVQRAAVIQDDDAPLAFDDDDATLLAEMEAAFDDSPVEEDDSVQNDAYPQVESDDESCQPGTFVH
jgi:hypothetical protein